MTEQLDTSAAAIAALLERVEEWWDYDHGNIFKDVANLLPALSTELTALRAERDAALARVKVLEAAINPPFPETWRDDAHDVHDRPGLRAQRTWAAGFNACRAASLAATEGKPL